MIPKPRHLGLIYASQSKEKPVVEAYRHRPPYPDEVFTILTSPITGEPRHVLDVGCSTGYLARPLAR